jgi:nucleoid-associated protein YgaU
MLQFWLSHDNQKQRIQLPVNPPEIRVRSGYNWTKVSITQVGDYTIPAGHPMTTISLSSFLPRDYDSSYCEYTDIPKPEDFIKKIAGWKESRTPIRLIVTGTWINYAMTIVGLEFWEQAGSPGDIYFQLDLQEYRFIALNRVQATTSKSTGLPTVAKASSKPPRPNTRQIPTTYVVKANDNLSKIVQRMRTLGHKNLTVPALYAANKQLIGKDMNLIKAGQKLTIPQ